MIDRFGYDHIRPFWPHVYAQEGEEQMAIKEYLRALKTDPNMFKAHYDLGVLYLNQEELEKSEFHFRQAIRIFPKSAQSHFNLAHVMELRGKPGPAQREYQEYQWLAR